MPFITSIKALPCSPYDDSDLVGIVITSGIPSYFKVVGTDLDQIESVTWYPKSPNSVEFRIRQLALVDPTQGTFMIQIINNQLNVTDRAGTVSFRAYDGSTISFKAITYGPVSIGTLWRPAQQGLTTG